MNFQLKTVLISFGVALAGSFVSISFNRTIQPADFFLAFGVIGFLGGLVELVIGFSLLFMQDKKYAQGLLISGGLLMLIGFTTCTASISGIGIH